MKAAMRGLLFLRKRKGEKTKTTNPSCTAKAPFNAPAFGIFAKSDGLTPVYKKKDEAPRKAGQSSPLLSLFSLPLSHFLEFLNTYSYPPRMCGSAQFDASHLFFFFYLLSLCLS